LPRAGYGIVYEAKKGKIQLHSNLTNAHELAKIFQKPADIRQSCLDNPGELCVIYIPVNMNQPVSEPSHLGQRVGELRVKGPFLFHDPESIGIIFGGAESIFCDYMIAEINCPFNGHNEVILGASDLVGIGKKFLFWQSLQVLQPGQGPENFRADLPQLVRIIVQSSGPP